MSKRTPIKVIQFPPGETEPLYVAARDVPKVIVGLSKSTLANWRCSKKGPPFHMVQGTPYYSWQELKNFFSQGRVETVTDNSRELDQEET